MTGRHVAQGFVFMIAVAACGHRGESARSQSDSAFAAMQARGETVMGVDQYASAHVFEDLVDGGRIVLDVSNASDTAGIVAIRHHMHDIATAFRAGDFAGPFRVHAHVVPGTSVMAARRTSITYDATDRPHGAEVRIRTTDLTAVAAIHAFLAFQRTAHHAAGHGRLHLPLAAALLAGSVSLQAQETVVGASDPDALFHSSDPRLDANKQVVYHIVKNLLEAGHWELADRYLTERYIQHNPNAASGRAGVVKYFTEVRKVKPVPIPEKMKTKVVSVVAEGDLVVVAYVHELKNAKDSSQSYTTTWFDMWRFKDGKADEHWDPATRMGQ